MKIGILGGGQLGRMFIQNALNYPVEVFILDPSPEAPCSDISCRFSVGDFNDYETVVEFGKNMDVIGIEIEHVNTDALKTLQKMGKTVTPDPKVLEIIKDKGKQKQFYIENNIPTAPLKGKTEMPFVQKLHTGGYDGKGVQIITENNVNDFWEAPSVLETLADIDKELAVIVARNESGETVVYPVVEQVFNVEYNLLDYLLTPARISTELEETAKNIALKVVNAFDAPGIYAIELFLNNNGEIWVNETAPRVHNSGHSTIESAYSSQFDIMLRVLTNAPLGSTDLKKPSAMLNLIGANDHTGKAVIKGIDGILKERGAYLHWYGKKQTKPGRKMGHITFLGNDFTEIITKIERIKKIVRVEAEG